MAAGVKRTVVAVVICLTAVPAGAGTLRGVVWPSAAEARRAARERASATPERYGPFGWFSRSRPASPAPAKPGSVATRAGTPAASKPATTPPPRAASTFPALRPQPALREAVVYLDAVPDKVERGLAQKLRRDRNRPNPRIVQAQSKFTPRYTLVAAGTAVEFQNLDRVWHNAFSVSSALRFDLGKYPPGRIDTVEFDRAGLVNLHCDIHPEETGFVMVLPNHAYVRPDSLGRFTLAKLPPGRYTLHLWHPRLGEASRTVEMPKHGDLDVDLAF